MKGVTKTIKNETKEQKEGFLSMLLHTLGASLLGNLLTGKGAGEGTVTAGYASSIKKKSSIPSNIEIENYYEDELRFNGVFSRDNWPKTKMEHI